MKRILIALVAGGAVAGAVFAAAAGLVERPDDLGAGFAMVASCDADGVDFSYEVGVDTGPGQEEQGPSPHMLTNITVDGIADRCMGQRFKLSILGMGGRSLAEFSGVVDSNSLANDLDNGVPAADVEHVALAIYGMPSLGG